MEAHHKRTIDRRWVEQTLAPYLRYAFSHELAHDADVMPQIEAALNWCKHNADHGLGSDDLLVERIMVAVDHPHMDVARDLDFVTSNMQHLATVLIRRVEVKGPYELCSRSVNIASDAWREYEAKRQEDVAVAKEEKQNAATIADQPVPPKPVPNELDIDPRLINALPGQYTSPLVSETLTVAEDQYLRQQIQRIKDYRRRAAALPSLQQQLHHAAASALPRQPSYKIPGRGWTYGDDPVYNSPPRAQAPSYVQDLGRRHGGSPAQAPPRMNGGVMDARPERLAFPNMYQHPAPMVTMPHVAAMPVPNYAQPRNTFAYQSFPPNSQQIQHAASQSTRQNVPTQYNPYVPPRMPPAPAPATDSGVQVADIAHLRGAEWTNTMTQRARETAANLSKSEKAERILHLHKTQHHPDSYLQPSPLKPEALPVRPLSSPAAPVFGANATFRPNMTPHPQAPMQHIEVPAPGAVGLGSQFANHPGFSNVRSGFPSTQYGGLTEATRDPAEEDVKDLAVDADRKRKR